MSARPTRAAVPSESFLARTGLQLTRLFGWRTLVIDLARAELKRENARQFLGGLWWVVDPLLQMIVYTILVSVIFARTQPDYPIFVLSALIAWRGIAVSIATGCTAITGNERIVRQIDFPRIVLPVARLGAQLWRLALALVVMVVLMLILWPNRVTPALAWLPILAVVEIVFLLPFVVFLSAATVFVRDLANLMRHVMRLALYVSPVLFGVDQLVTHLPEPIATLYAVNPISLLLEAFRSVAYYGTAPTPTSILMPIGAGLLLLPFALAWFGRVERGLGKLL